MSNVNPDGTAPNKEASSNNTSYSGYLIICGGCSKSILFPEGAEYIKCPSCKQLNYLNPQSTNALAKKAALQCPKCHRLIQYTIGCTHFICVCGGILTIQEPEYYIPHYPSSDSN